MSELAGLIARLEKATRPDEELDARIWCAVFAPPEAYVEQSKFNGTWCIYCGTNSRNQQPRLYEGSKSLPVTGSVDAALRLVPPGWFVSNLAQWRSGQPMRTWAATLKLDPDCEKESHTSDKPSAAIALCIVALRACEATA